MPSIYELKNEFLTLWAILDSETIEDDVLADAFKNATDDLKDKLENCCKYIANEKAIIQGLKEEEARLKAKRQAKENAVERLKALMLEAMNTAGEKKLPCGSFTCGVQKNSVPALIIDEQYIENVPDEFKIIPEPMLDKDKIKEALKKGEDIHGIAHFEYGEHLTIR